MRAAPFPLGSARVQLAQNLFNHYRVKRVLIKKRPAMAGLCESFRGQSGGYGALALQTNDPTPKWFRSSKQKGRQLSRSGQGK
jgi:hypothetical protein